jgi:peptide/nickel transport system permease protein
MTPGDVTIIIAGDMPLPPEQVAKIRSDLGLDRPLYEQMVIYVLHILRGDLGYSFISRRPVIQLIFERLPLTLLLTFLPMMSASILGIVLGVVASRKQYSLTDNLTSFLALIGFSIPVFWLGLLLLLCFAFYLGWFPTQGSISLRTNLEGVAYWIDLGRHLVLPATTLGMFQVAIVTRMTRASMLESLTQDYVTWARSKGLPERTVVFRHALRNALIPVTTLIGYQFGYLLTGAALVETVFAWPGLGRLLVESVLLRDFPILTGLLIFVSFMTIIANFLADITYAFLDPRIRYR